MSLRTSIIIAIALLGLRAAFAKEASDQELARLLANNRTRQSAVAKILASANGKGPLLLSWTRKPPAHVDEYELCIGLADAFGSLKTKEAIPFLIKNIGVRRTRYVDLNPWLKAPEVIEEAFPAMAALIQIGPDASKALVRASRKPMVSEDRLAAIFAVSRIKDVPEARAFLTSTLGEANQERHWAEEGLKLLDANSR